MTEENDKIGELLKNVGVLDYNIILTEENPMRKYQKTKRLWGVVVTHHGWFNQYITI